MFRLCERDAALLGGDRPFLVEVVGITDAARVGAAGRDENDRPPAAGALIARILAVAALPFRSRADIAKVLQ